MLREAITASSAATEEAAQPSVSPRPETVPVSADFAALKSNNPDVCGWLYSPDTYATSPAFTFPATESNYGLLLKDIETYNYLAPKVSAADGDRLLCMSTCTVSDDQRFMVIAKMTPLD